MVTLNTYAQLHNKIWKALTLLVMKYLIWGTLLPFSLMFQRKHLANDTETYTETTDSVDNKFI